VRQGRELFVLLLWRARNCLKFEAFFYCEKVPLAGGACGKISLTGACGKIALAVRSNARESCLGVSAVDGKISLGGKRSVGRFPSLAGPVGKSL